MNAREQSESGTHATANALQRSKFAEGEFGELECRATGVSTVGFRIGALRVSSAL